MGNILNSVTSSVEEPDANQEIHSAHTIASFATHVFEQDNEYLLYWTDAESNKIALDVPLKKENGIKVTAYPLHCGTHQRYKLYHHEDNYCHIQNQFSKKYLELQQTLIQNEYHHTNPFQQFKLTKISTTDHTYTIITKGHGNGFCLDGSDHSFHVTKHIPSKRQQQFTIELFNDNAAEYQVAPSTYIVWHTSLANNIKNKNKICVMYSIQPLQSHHCTYWSCVFPKGYMGIQDKTTNLKWIIFSIWDVTLEDVLEVGRDTVCDLFDGEGVGVRTNIEYNWDIGDTYTFKVVYENEKNDKMAKISSYFLKGNALSDGQFDHKGFQLIASIKAPNDGSYLFDGKNRFTNFTEDWDSGGGNGHIARKALFGNVKILNNGVLMHCNAYHEWCPETRPFKADNFCVKGADDENVCMIIGGCSKETLSACV
eukprot:124363_1